MKTKKIDKSKTNPGFHRQFALSRFSYEEQSILRKLSREWYMTNSGREIFLASTKYNFCLIKPTEIFTEMFNIDREIICIFSDYPNFEPRTLDAFDAAQKFLPDLRVETVCRVLISRDNDVESKIEKLLKNDPEQPVVIPFSYDELSTNYDEYFLRNRFRKHFYSRDLFAFLSPLKRDIYFFGRSELVQQIVNRHRSSEHTGLFGLRKSGKTSIIYAVERSLKSNNEQYLSIDCESPSVHKRRWNELLFKIATEYKSIKKSKSKISNEIAYDEKNASDSFERDMLKIFKSKKEQSIIIIFDEIERISPCTGSSKHWKEEDDFVYFWQTLRGFYQKHPEIFTYMVVGTNPNCIEIPIICSQENPLFSSIPCQYVPSFTIPQTKQMVSDLGKYMGINFDELIFSKINDDLGGHPFLIRQLCSLIHNSCNGPRPLNVDKALYEKIKKEFFISSVQYFDMILQVLKDWYPDEYDMLTFLAQNDENTFNQFAHDHARYTKHLIGYGLIQQSENGFSFSIESIKYYLQTEHKFERLNLTEEEKVSEISSRRNALEKKLRTIVKNTLKLSLGKKKAGEKVLASIPESRRKTLGTNDIEILLSQDSSPLYFLDITNIINREWESFKNVFEMDKNKFLVMMKDINECGRPDAHAKFVKEDDFEQLRLYFKKMESILSEWID